MCLFFWHSTPARKWINRQITSACIHLHPCANMEADLNTNLDVAAHAPRQSTAFALSGGNRVPCKNQAPTYTQERTWFKAILTHNTCLVRYNVHSVSRGRCLARFVQAHLARFVKLHVFEPNCILCEAISCTTRVSPATYQSAQWFCVKFRS